MAAGTKDDPWELKTPPGTSSYTMYQDEQADPPALVCQVGSTTLKYQLRAIDDLHTWLAGQGDWVPLGAADEQKPAPDRTVEAWGRSADNPVGGPKRPRPCARLFRALHCSSFSPTDPRPAEGRGLPCASTPGSVQ